MNITGTVAKLDEVVDKGKSSAAGWITMGKDAVALLRDLLLLVLVLLLLFLPHKINQVLSEAGFEEGTFVGIKWKPKLLKSDEALKEAQVLITDLKEQNEKMSKALADAQNKLNDRALKEYLTSLEKTNQQLNATSTKVENSVASTIASNASLIERVQGDGEEGTKWGVVYSGDAALETARYEIETIAPKLGIPNATVYLRQGSYRSVSVVNSRSEAQQVLIKAKQRRVDAYIVNMSHWCPNSNERSGYRECVSP